MGKTHPKKLGIGTDYPNFSCISAQAGPGGQHAIDAVCAFGCFRLRAVLYSIRALSKDHN